MLEKLSEKQKKNLDGLHLEIISGKYKKGEELPVHDFSYMKEYFGDEEYKIRTEHVFNSNDSIHDYLKLCMEKFPDIEVYTYFYLTEKKDNSK